jgi:hypothetical protein
MDVDWELYEDNLPLILMKVHQRREDDAAIVDLCVHVHGVESRYVYRQLAAIRAGSIDDDLSDDEIPLDQVATNLTEKRRALIEYRRFLELFWSCRNSLGEAFGFLSRGEVYLCAPFGVNGVGSVTGDKHPFNLMRVMTWTMLPQAKRAACCHPIDRAFAYRLLPVVPGWSIDETISGERLSRVSEWLRLSWREETSSIYRTSIGNIQVHVRMQCTGEDDMCTITQDATNLDAVHAWGRYYGRMKMMPQFGAEYLCV